MSDGSPVTIEFNVHISGAPDLTFYGYSTEKASLPGFDDFVTSTAANAIQTQAFKIRPKNKFVTTTQVTPNETIVKTRREMIEKKFLPRNVTKAQALSAAPSLDFENIMTDWKSISGKRKPRKFSCLCSCEAESLTVMNEPQRQDDDSMKQDAVVDLNHVDRLAPNVDMRPYIRRMYRLTGSIIPLENRQTQSISIPLNSILGEDPVLRTELSSPTTLLSNMYYGKTAGFKFKVVTTVLNQSFALLSPVISVRCRYVPPNMNFLLTNNTVVQTTVDLANDDSTPYAPGPNGFYPLPYQITPVITSQLSTASTYEFVIPDVTYYKFMGSPNKLGTPFTLYTLLSTYDFGSLVLTFENLSIDGTQLGVEIFAGLTDETRFGYHTIAPLVSIMTNGTGSLETLYGGNPNDVFAAPLSARNNYLYKGGFL